MIRFVEVHGIDIDDNKKYFGFYNTTFNTFLSLSNSIVFESITDFELFYDENCKIDKKRLDGLIPDSWLEYEKSILDVD